MIVRHRQQCLVLGTVATALTLNSSPASAASPETYFGIDYWETNRFRLPQYGVSRNLVQNSGFEARFHGWRMGRRGNLKESKGDTYFIEQNAGISGRRCLRIEARKNQSPAHLTSFAIPVEAGATYTLSFYAQADQPDFTLNYTSTTAEWPVFVSRNFPLSTEWKRYEYTFKAPNEMLQVDLGVENPPRDGRVWVDNVQMEKGALSDYTEQPLVAELVTNKRGNWLQPGEPVGARLELSGTPEARTDVNLKISDFFGKTFREESHKVKLGKNGEARIPLPSLERIDSGIYLVEASLKRGDFLVRDFYRVTIAPYADNSTEHKNLFAYGAEGWTLGSWDRRMDFYKRAGIGSAMIFEPAPHEFFKAMHGHGIVNVTSIFGAGENSGEWNLKKDYHRSEADLKIIEENAYQKALQWPEIRYWKLVNEPGNKMSASLEEMKAFVQVLQAAQRGIKRANPKSIVLSPDPANLSPRSGIPWMNLFLEAGGHATCDAIAIHPYRPRPEEPDMDADMATFLKVLDKQGYKGEVWFTEGMGNFPVRLPQFNLDPHKALSQEEGKSGGWRVGPLSYDIGIGERIAAAYAMRSWLVGLKYAQRVKQQVNWYFFYNSTLDYDMTPGAEIFASNTLTNLLGNSRFERDVELGEGGRGYLFEDDKKRPVAALWTTDVRIDKQEVPGPTVDISGLPTGVEIFDFTGRRITRTRELVLGPWPIFIRGTAANRAAVIKALTFLPVRAANSRQLLPSIKVTGARKGELQLQNLLARPVSGRLEVTQASKPLFKGEITVGAKSTWNVPLTIASEAGQISTNQFRLHFRPSSGEQIQTAELSLDTLAVQSVAKPLVIDGDLSDWPANSRLQVPNRLITFGNKPAYGGTTDLSANFYSAWDKENLYLAFEVADDTFMPSGEAIGTWSGDSVQLYFDSFQNAGAAKRPGFDSDDQTMDLWPNGNALEVYRAIAPDVQLAFLKTGRIQGAKSAFRRTTTGYNLEVAISATDLTPIFLQPGNSFGFSFIINDKDDDANGRKRGLALTPAGTEPYQNPQLYTAFTLKP